MTNFRSRAEQQRRCTGQHQQHINTLSAHRSVPAQVFKGSFLNEIRLESKNVTMLVSLTSTVIPFIIVLFIPTVTDTDGIRLRVRTEKRKTWSQKESEEWE